MAEPSPTRRRFWQFSLRGLLVLLALVAVVFGIWSNASAQREWRALKSFDKGLRVSLMRRNSLGPLEYVQGFQGLGQRIRLGDPPAPWVLWRDDTVQSLFIQCDEPRMAATALDPLVDIPDIERLELAIDEMDPRAIKSLADLRQLESFEWSGNFDEACLLALPQLPSIERLELKPKDGGRLGTGLQALERIPNLNHLTIDRAPGSGTVVLSQAKLSPTPLALELGVDSLMFRPSGNTFDLSDMSAWSSVYYLELSSVEPSTSIDFASMPNLQTIELKFIDLTLADVEQLVKLPKLERLTLRATGVKDAQMARLLSNPNLKGVVVNESDVTSEAFAGLANCRLLEKLKVPQRVVDAEFLEVLKKAPALNECEVFPETNSLRRDDDIGTLQWQIDEMLKKK